MSTNAQFSVDVPTFARIVVTATAPVQTFNGDDLSSKYYHNVIVITVVVVVVVVAVGILAQPQHARTCTYALHIVQYNAAGSLRRDSPTTIYNNINNNMYNNVI
jgi:hypothetical protein